MKIFNKCHIPAFKRFSSIQIPYFFHTAIFYPYQIKESKNFYINFEKRQVVGKKESDIWFVNENFLKELNNFKFPRENILIYEIPEEEGIFQLVEKCLPYLSSLQCGVTLIFSEQKNIPKFEKTLIFFSVHNYLLFGEKIENSFENINAIIYPFFPGFSDTPEKWEEHLSFFKNHNISYIFPLTVYFDSTTIRNFFEIAKENPSILKRLEEVFHIKSRKEYIKNLWQKFVPFVKSRNFKVLPPLPEQSGELYENKLLAQRAFFLWHWLILMERDIEAWQFHRLGFKLWRLQFPVRQIFKEGNLNLFELNLIEDFLKGDPYLYPDEEIWL
jgi:hypothetical protein